MADRGFDRTFLRHSHRDVETAIASQKVFYRTTGVEEVKRYITEMDYRFSGQGGAKISLPDEVLDKLGIK